MVHHITGVLHLMHAHTHMYIYTYIYIQYVYIYIYSMCIYIYVYIVIIYIYSMILCMVATSYITFPEWFLLKPYKFFCFNSFLHHLKDGSTQTKRIKIVGSTTL